MFRQRVPVISMQFPEYVSLNDMFEVALLIENTEPQSIRAAVEKLIQDKDYYFRLRENCLIARQEWNWQKEQINCLPSTNNCNGSSASHHFFQCALSTGLWRCNGCVL
jgi:hypothetical protein